MESTLKSITASIMAYTGCRSVKEINCGDCYRWAYLAHKVIPNTILCSIWQFGGHAFIKVGDAYYDSESPGGVSDWRELKFFAKQKKYELSDHWVKIQSLRQFIKYWDGFKVLPIYKIYLRDYK